MTRKKANGSNQSATNDAFRNIVEAAPMGLHFYQLEPDGRLVFSGANQAADRFLGVDNSQFIGQTIEEAFPSLVETDIPDAYRRVAQTGECWQTEQVVYQEGQIAGAFEVHAFQVSPGRMAAAFINITERKQTEARLQESEEKFRQLECQRQELLAHRERQVQVSSEIARVIAAAPGLDPLFSQVIDLMREKFGYYHVHLYLLDEDELVMKAGTGEAGQQLQQAGHKIALATERNLVARAAREGRALLAPDVDQEPDGLPNPLLPATKSELVVPVKLGDRVLGVMDVQDDRPGSLSSEDELLLVGLCGQLASAIDKTRLVEQLEQQHNLFQAILHSIPVGVFVVEAPTGRPILSNERAEELLGRGIAPEATEDEAAEVYETFVYGTDEPYPAQRRPLARGMQGEAAIIEDMEVRRPDGQNLLLQVFGAPIFSAAGEVVASVAVFQDITERKQAEQLLARRANELQAVTELSTAISSILETNLLLQEMVDLTKSRFDLYHAHIYVLDEAGENLVLAAGAGDVGRKMAAEGWHIPLAKERSLVARAARSRQVVVVNDVRSEPDFLPNPALPDTRSEMALPLVAGEVLLGVLDVQSDLVGRFTEEDARLKNTLVAQAAVALQNARLFADQERMSRSLNERVKELNCLNEIGRAVAEAPEIGELLEWVTERVPPAMRYPEECVAAIEYEGHVYGVAETLDLPCQMAHALRIGGEVLGRVYIAYRQKREFLNEESAMLGGIASRLSGHLESRRLLAQIQTALEEVEQSQEFLRTVIDSIPVPVFIIDINDVYLDCNRAFLEYIQRPGEDIVGKSIYELYDKEVADQYHEADQQIYRNPGVYQFEINIQRVDGSPATLIYNRATFTDRDGRLAGQVATILDITERKAVEESLLRNETRLSEALQLAHLAYWEFDVKTQMFTFNDQLYALFGTTAEEQGGYQVSAEDFARKFIHPDEADTVGTQIQQALETTDPDYAAHFESRIVHGDGQEGYIAVQLKVAKDEQGQTVKLYGTNQDVTEQKLAELEREQLLAEVEATYRQYVRHEWEQFMDQRQAGNWRIEHRVPGVSGGDNGSGDMTVIPIDLRGQPIGTISLQDASPNHHWTEDDQTLVEAVSEQLALTVENLRLFSATQQQAVREHLARQITDKMRSAPDVDSIIQTGLNELAKALGAARAYVRLSPKQAKPAAGAEADTPDIEAIRSQLKHNGHKPPAASSQLPDQPADTTGTGLAGKAD